MSDLRKSTLLWWVIPGVLAGMPMPFVHPERRLSLGGPLNAYEDELPGLYAAGIRSVVSLLNIPTDRGVFESAGFSFLCLPVPDGGAPTMEQADEFVRFMNAQRQAQRPAAVHCEAGLGRTGTMLAVYLIFHGDTAEMAITMPGCPHCRAQTISKSSISAETRLPASGIFVSPVRDRAGW